MKRPSTKCPYSQSRLCFAYLTKRTKLFSRLCVQSSIKVNRNTALITLKGNENKFASINLNLESQAKTKSSDRFNEKWRIRSLDTRAVHEAKRRSFKGVMLRFCSSGHIEPKFFNSTLVILNNLCHLILVPLMIIYSYAI